MKHSILITHRCRESYLEVCLWSLYRSAAACGITDVEVIIAHVGHVPPVAETVGCTILLDHDHPATFNKARLHNLAIEAASGDVLTFLDCDALVNRHFCDGIAALTNPRIIRLCYRVRLLPATMLRTLLDTHNRNDLVDSVFAAYDTFTLGYEAYGTTLSTVRSDGMHPIGNSQFSIRREVLCDMRFDEQYVGHGMEDLDMAEQIMRRYGANYKAAIVTDAEHAMFHLQHTYTADWRTDEMEMANMRRFKEKWR